MKNRQPVYEKARTTERPAETLVRRHGFDSIAHLAESLPQDAKVIDVGAGASDFGAQVAGLRPDISWINFDYSYGNQDILNEVSEGAPENMEFVAGDATKLDQIYEPDSFDASFSYWLFPHLSLDEMEPAEQAARAIFRITKPQGLISIGPQVRTTRLLRRARTLKYIKGAETNADDFASLISKKTRLFPHERMELRMTNEVQTSFFGTSRHRKRIGKRRYVYDPRSEEYVHPFSLRSVQLLGKVGLAEAAYLMKRKK
jgi:ubiquinone/menaquinone biosynthesis C-methylase UbiE